MIRTWSPRPSKHPLPPLPTELAERPGIVWVYTCMMAGLSLSDLRTIRIDQADALIELQEFVRDASIHADEDAKAQQTASTFWDL